MVKALCVVCALCATTLKLDAQGARYEAAIREGRDAMTQLVARGQAPGVGVAVMIGGQLVWTEGFGFASLEHRVPVSPDTRFGLGSISKTLTMAAAMRLVDKGLLDLDAPVETYLPDFPHRGRGISVRRIAAHQSGLSDAFATQHYQTTRDFPTLDPAYQEIKKAPIEFPPGTKTVYATGLFTIIGRVLEAVSKTDYRTLMAREVFAPLTITPFVNDARTIIPNRSGYYANREGGGFDVAPAVNPTHKLPGAGWVATAADVARLGAALLKPAFLSDRARAEMFRPVPLADGTATEWALGLQVGRDTHGQVLHIPGGGLGISGWLFVHPDAGVVIALLSNVNTSPVGGRAYRRIADAFISAARP